MCRHYHTTMYRQEKAQVISGKRLERGKRQRMTMAGLETRRVVSQVCFFSYYYFSSTTDYYLQKHECPVPRSV